MNNCMCQVSGIMINLRNAANHQPTEKISQPKAPPGPQHPLEQPLSDSRSVDQVIATPTDKQNERNRAPDWSESESPRIHKYCRSGSGTSDGKLNSFWQWMIPHNVFSGYLYRISTRIWPQKIIKTFTISTNTNRDQMAGDFDVMTNRLSLTVWQIGMRKQEL